MAKNKFEASQSIWFVAKVVGAKKEDKEVTKSKKKYVEYSLTAKLPEGNAIFIRKKRWELTDGKVEADFVKESFDKLDKIIEDVNANKPVFISKFISKPKEKAQFDWLTSYQNDDGRVSHSIEGFVNIQDFDIEGDDKFIIKFKESSTVFTDIESKIEVYMYVVDTDGDKIILTDGKEEYPNEFIVTVPEGMENKAEIGQAYYIKSKPIKGKKVKIDGIFDFDGTSSDGYEPDKFEIVGLKKLDKIVLTTVGDNTKAGNDEDTPF